MRALDLFCGMGGASLGLEQAGFEVTGVEFDGKAVEMHRHVCDGDVHQRDIAAANPLEYGGFDILWASPPCQPFSSAGLRQGMNDPRAHLIFQVPRWVHHLRPRFVICEQVKQALPWWEAFAADFAEYGYHTWTGMLSAEQYGVPQTRQRAFLLASLDGPVTPPPPTHERCWTRKPHMRPSLGLEPYVTMADVLNVDEDATVGFPRRDDLGGDGYRERDMRPASEPAFTMTSKGRSWHINTGRDWKPGGDRSTAQRRDGDQPAPTVTANSTEPWRIEGDGTSRNLTVQDGLALQTFPPDCLDGLDVTKTAAFTAIGNAVPPLLAEVIARHLTTTERNQP